MSNFLNDILPLKTEICLKTCWSNISFLTKFTRLTTMWLKAMWCTPRCRCFTHFQSSQASGLRLYEKRDSGTGAFLWILRNFKEHLFYRTLPDNCFWLNTRTMHFLIWLIVFVQMNATINCLLLGNLNWSSIS